MSGTRPLPNILITGTPGTGKTSTAELFAEQSGFNHINVSQLVKERGFHEEQRDEEYDSLVIDEEALLDEMEVLLKNGGYVVDFHGSEMFPERWFDLVIVLRTDNSILFDRLKKRGYNDTKLNDNIEAEIMQLMLDEARDSYRPEIVHECNSNTLEDLEQNVARIVQWTDLYKKEHQ